MVRKKLTPSAAPLAVAYETRLVSLDDLKPHPRHYRQHPDDHLAHLGRSLAENGWYRNVVTARDLTLLAGHGVVQAARQASFEQAPVCCLDLHPDDPRALKILAGDNEVSHLAERDDRALTELLKSITDTDPSGLVSTGYDPQKLANLAFVTRPASELKDCDEAAHWVGMPEYTPEVKTYKLVVHFRSLADRERFGDLIGVQVPEQLRSTWWPPKAKRDDPASVRFE
jgi:hypothetical protein